MFEDCPGYFRETQNDQVMEKVDEDGHVIGFSILKVSALQSVPFEVALSAYQNFRSGGRESAVGGSELGLGLLGGGARFSLNGFSDRQDPFRPLDHRALDQLAWFGDPPAAGVYFVTRLRTRALPSCRAARRPAPPRHRDRPGDSVQRGGQPARLPPPAPPHRGAYGRRQAARLFAQSLDARRLDGGAHLSRPLVWVSWIASA